MHKSILSPGLFQVKICQLSFRVSAIPYCPYGMVPQKYMTILCRFIKTTHLDLSQGCLKYLWIEIKIIHGKRLTETCHFVPGRGLKALCSAVVYNDVCSGHSFLEFWPVQTNVSWRFPTSLPYYDLLSNWQCYVYDDNLTTFFKMHEGWMESLTESQPPEQIVMWECFFLFPSILSEVSHKLVFFLWNILTFLRKAFFGSSTMICPSDALSEKAFWIHTILGYPTISDVFFDCKLTTFLPLEAQSKRTNFAHCSRMRF